MQIKETPDVSFPGVVESPPLEDVVVLADNAGVALGVQRAFSARVRSVRDDGSGLIASRCVEIPLVGRDGEISGVLCRTVRHARRVQPSKCISNGQDSPSCLWHSKQHQEEARFCCLLGVTFQSLTRLTGISH
jgi:hypothetical protein